MHFNDATNLNLQKPDIIEHHNPTKSGVGSVDQMTGTYEVARNTSRWPMVISYTVLFKNTFTFIAEINAQTIPMLNSNVKIRSRIFIKNLIMHLVSEQINRQSEISSGVYKSLHLNLHQFKHKLKEILMTT